VVATPEPSPVRRYRCTSCGNLTRFTVTSTRRTSAFHHFTVGGELTIEDVEVLEDRVESVTCRWCGTGAGVVELEGAPSATETAAAVDRERAG
jgi:hypothetical protein